MRLWPQQETCLERYKAPGFEVGEKGAKRHRMCVASRAWEKLASRNRERQEQIFLLVLQKKNHCNFSAVETCS